MSSLLSPLCRLSPLCPQIVGILNVTPDSYFDGGKYNTIHSATERVKALLDEGADIIDIGGESTGPGSKEVSEEEELERVIPLIKKIIQEYPSTKLSVDTYKSKVADASLSAGASMINDVTAGRGDKKMFDVLAFYKVPIVLMYAKDATARTTIDNRDYNDVVGDIIKLLQERKEEAMHVGISSENVIVDPGMGHFLSSKPEYAFRVLADIKKIAEETGCPVFVSPSRKSFLAGEENLLPEDRLPGTIVASAIATLNGAAFIRTHDVLDVRRGCSVAQNFMRAQSL
jgi:dihydropteroate synthase